MYIPALFRSLYCILFLSLVTILNLAHMSTELVTSFYCRNTKSSQEVVDFVGQKLREGVREREMQSLGALLETVCEEVSWGGVVQQKWLGRHFFPPFNGFTVILSLGLSSQCVVALPCRTVPRCGGATWKWTLSSRRGKVRWGNTTYCEPSLTWNPYYTHGTMDFSLSLSVSLSVCLSLSLSLCLSLCLSVCFCSAV